MSPHDPLEFDELPKSADLPRSGRLGGLDFGTVRLGVAISDPGQRLASPLETYARRNEALDGRYLRELAEQERLVGWVIGLPVHMSGQASQKSREAVAFGQWVAETTHLPVAWVDERYSTAMAREVLQQSSLSGKKRKAQLDKLAAQILLTTYLESRPQEPPRELEDLH